MPVDEKTTAKTKIQNKTYTSLVTQNIVCNKEFSLVKGEEIPKGIASVFIQSLISSNLIK